MTSIQGAKQFLQILLIFITIIANDAYKIVFERCEVTGFNKTLGGNMKFAFTKVNRTNFALNVNFDLYQDMNADLMTVTAQVYKFASNDYKLYPVALTVNVCKESKRELFFRWSEALSHGNIPMCGPMKKGNYYLRNYVLQFKLPDVPVKQGRYKIHGIVRQAQSFLFEGDAYGSIQSAIN